MTHLKPVYDSEYCEGFVDLSHFTIEQASDKVIYYAEHL